MDKEKILRKIQEAGNKVTEAMNLVVEAGQEAGINVSFTPKSVTLEELARIVSAETALKESCVLEALETAFDILEDQQLILDLGDEREVKRSC